MLTLIVARDRNGAIGKGNEIPWHAPEDLAFFSRETRGGAVIMGRKTWESLPEAVKPLKGRLNIVVSSQEVLGEFTVPSLDAALDLAREKGHARIYGMGGARVYEGLMPLAHRLLITEVDLMVEAPDTYFPAFSAQDWQEISRFPLRAADPACTLTEYLRRAP